MWWSPLRVRDLKVGFAGSVGEWQLAAGWNPASACLTEWRRLVETIGASEPAEGRAPLGRT